MPRLAAPTCGAPCIAHVACVSAAADGGASAAADATTATTTAAPTPTLKIADFGLSALVTSPVDLCGTMCGSPMYAAPELFQGTAGGEYDASKTDMWSCGVILYALLSGNLPFDAGSLAGLATQVRHGVPRAVRRGQRRHEI